MRTVLEKILFVSHASCNKKNQSGQALLIMVLIMVVSLTVGLSVASRSVTNLRTSTEEENSQRAFSAAEAGIEQVIKLNQTGTDIIINKDLGNNSKISNVSITAVSGRDYLINDGNPIEKDDGIDIWLVPHDANGNPDYSNPGNWTLTFYWGLRDIGECNIAALEIIVISGNNLSEAKSKRYTEDPCSNRRSLNHFGNTSSGGESAPAEWSYKFEYKTGTPIIVSDGILVRVVPLYFSSTIGVSSNRDLPQQGKRIESVGKSGDTTRRISFFQGYPKVPSEFFYSLFWPK